MLTMEGAFDKDIRHILIAMTLRMALISIVGLISSSMVLRALGVDDYGIYCAVAGLVWVFAFLNSSITDSSTRYITYALGTGNLHRFNETFSAAFRLHAITSVVVILIAEICGLWYLHNKMVLPPESYHVAGIVFQLVLASMIIGLMQQPYVSLLLAHERFRLYSYIEMAEALINLLLVIFLVRQEGDKLILYASLLLAIRVFVAGIYMAYSHIRYPESRLKMNVGKDSSMKEMLAFSGCGVYGNICVTAYSQGNPLLLNMFFGVVANASASLAGTVSGVVSSIATTGISRVYSPLITKGYASADISETERHLCNSVKATVYSFGLLLIPAIIFMPEILTLWLGDVPPHAVNFSRFSLVTAMLGSVICVTNTAIHATGDIRRLSFVNGSIYLLCPLLVWLAYVLGAHILALFAIEVVVTSAILVNGCFILKRQVPEMNMHRYAWAMVKSLSVVGGTLAVSWFVRYC